MSPFMGEVHPLAARWPMLPDDELAALAQDIADNGQVEPITLDAAARLVDGRNRPAACAIAEVEPRFIVHEALESDAATAEFINAKNAQRRNVSTGQKAMSVAEQLAAQGKRKDGRWWRGSINENSRLSDDKAWPKMMQVAGIVIDYAPHLADQVIGGTITRNDAATQAEATRDTAIREAKQAEERTEQLAKMREYRPDIGIKVDNGSLSEDDALKIVADELAKEQKAKDDAIKWAKKLAAALCEAVNNAGTVAHPNNIPDLIAGWNDHPTIRPPLSKNLTAHQIREAARQLNTVADEWSTT